MVNDAAHILARGRKAIRLSLTYGASGVPARDDGERGLLEFCIGVYQLFKDRATEGHMPLPLSPVLTGETGALAPTGLAQNSLSQRRQSEQAAEAPTCAVDRAPSGGTTPLPLCGVVDLQARRIRSRITRDLAP